MGLLLLGLLILDLFPAGGLFRAVLRPHLFSNLVTIAALLGALATEFVIVYWVLAGDSSGGRHLRDEPRVSRRRLAARWVGLSVLHGGASAIAIFLVLATPILDALPALYLWIAVGIAHLVMVSGTLTARWIREQRIAPVTRWTRASISARFAAIQLASAAAALGVGWISLAGKNAWDSQRHKVVQAARDETKYWPCPDTLAVVVRRLDQELPAETKEMEEFLRREFANKPEERSFRNCTNDDWETKYARFSRALASRGRAAELDSESLAACLDSLRARGVARGALPVGAYHTHQADADVWIVILRSGAYSPTSPDHAWPLNHTRVSVLDAATAREIGKIADAPALTPPA